MEKEYKEDLAYIHDVGFRDYALKSAPGILAILAQHQIREGLVVDLGCGSGLWAQELVKANYHVFGVDSSESMIAIERTRVLERRSSIPRNRVSRQDDNAISTFHPKKPGFLTDVLEAEFQVESLFKA
ncbi:MAG: class I SAM-dependent methyltransferase [Coleofasciculus sp. F4-SAH-05]